MRKIYLASDSKARKKLLDIFGLKFKAVSSRIKERVKPGNSSYAELVKKNALAKAKGVARKVRNGIIIGADTIVVQDGRISGKPKNLKEAQRMLKRLSQRPQWLYTGLAVIDKDKGISKLAYEKTKVYMDKLNDKEIKNYFRVVSPLDKAGSFDIQGRGAFFIRRIEGCFYNVVGLPLRRLYRMFKEIGIIMFLLSFFLCGCASEYNIATKQEESFYYSTEREVQIGKTVARQVEEEYKPDVDPLIQKRVEDIGNKIAAVCDRKDIDYHFMVLDDEEVNAVSLPGGYVYVNKGLVDAVTNDDELAGVLAHEVGHIVARHSIKKLQAITGYSILRILTAAVPQGAQVGNAADAAFTEIMLGYSREDELLADQLAARYAKMAGYNPRGMVDFLLRLQDINRRKPLRPKNYFKTHPYVPDRVRVVKQELGENMDFDDYINIEQKSHGQ
ncbi:MAG: Maf and M48 domain-containing protein [Candidatus Omnitrophica bacterium]|nr:Maf and M48 domain-containing protein [Candidatus Omnitrophota bacterium]MDD5592980.1 Maf and M48 domain-containing protein [Candidatus Omnitrophota bacterium]